MRSFSPCLPFLFLLTVIASGQDQPRSLSDDKRVATLGDVQGIVSVRSPIATRWSLARPERPLTEGDWIRTDVRGANAVRAILTNGARLVLGPGTLLEMQGPGTLKLIRGELEIDPGKKGSVFLNGSEVKKSGIWRLPEDGDLARLEKEPLWLSGFKGVMTTEAMGSLIAKVDGRDVPLTVGYHKVNVEIRDQIARTTIEESFVNHTKSRTEGVFYFPLPQEASISGFGMWIGNELVEADVVEKQRAREIYETILREKRDPGLLEWTGGNLFKARVFPILPNSEKRIKITYTQVLPLEGDTFRYRYGLDSELLRQNPVRDLEINVRIFSADGVEQVVCPTHPGARVESTGHAASVRFEAQEYSPDRDFEILVKPVLPESNVTLIPHRRGEDGYFLASLRVPDLQNIRAESLKQESEPLEILFLADTSGSIDDAQREVQANVISAILNQLGDEDQFTLAVCDVACAFWKPKPEPVNDKTIAQARAFFDRRVSMGWSDLGKTFGEVMKRIGPKTQVIYLGDGIPATAATDPVAFADRLKRSFKGKGTFHAIATGSTHEAVVMKAIASLGGGSFRKVGGSDTPAAVAASLMDEIANPGYRDLQVAFEGVRTARVYPERLANVPAGSQRFVVGRFLPGGKTTKGEMVITGRHGGNQIEWRLPVTFDESAEDGHENAFIPRLWARKHLDVLLEQGATRFIRDEIIGLSEEYKIMTPYTSFLVLESEADRKRFKVKRRFQMRGGEQYFTEGAEAARFELVQAQMQRAAAWRRDLRARILFGLERMGRNPLGQSGPATYTNARMFAESGGSDPFSGRKQHGGTSDFRIDYGIPFGGGGGGGGGNEFFTGTTGFGSGSLHQFNSKNGDSNGAFYDGYMDFLSADEEITRQSNRGWNFQAAADPFSPAPMATARPVSAASFPVTPATPANFDIMPGQNFASEFEGFSEHDFSTDTRFIARKEGFDLNGSADFFTGSRRRTIDGLISNWELGASMGKYYRGNIHAPPQSILSRFPNVPAPNPKRVENPEAGPDRPAGVRELVESLLRRDALIARPFDLETAVTQFNTRRDRVSDRNVTRRLLGSVEGDEIDRPWLIRSREPDSSGTFQWSADKVRGFYKIAEGLGRTREAVEDDADDWLDLLDFPSGMIQPLLFRTWKQARLEPSDKPEQTWLIFSSADGNVRHGFLIDRQKSLVVLSESWIGEELQSSTRVTESVEFGGVWWPKVYESLDGDGKVRQRSVYTFRETDGNRFDTELAGELAATKQGIILRELDSLVEARRRIDAGEATLEDWMILIVRYSISQEWKEVENHLEKFAEAAGGDDTAGALRWLWLRHFNLSRQNERLRQRALLEAPPIAKSDPLDDAFPLIEALRNETSSLSVGEQIEILQIVRPAYEKADAASDWRESLFQWGRGMAQLMDSFPGASDAERLEQWQSLAAEYDFDRMIHHEVANHLWRGGEYEAARTYVRGQLERDYWNAYERWQLRDHLLRWWEQEGRYREIAAHLSDLLGEEGITSSIFQKYLQGLLWSGQEEKHDDTLKSWAREIIATEGTLEAIADQRAHATTNAALGNGMGRHSNFVLPRWEPLLMELGRKLFRDPDRYTLAASLLNNWRFKKLDAYPKLQKEVGEFLVVQGPALGTNQLTQLFAWAELDEDEWKALGGKLIDRWRNEDDPKLKDSLGAFLNQQGHRLGDPGRHLEFLRERMAGSEETVRHSRASELFEWLLKTPWNETVETEAYALLPELIPADPEHASSESSLATAINALFRLDDHVEKKRHEAIRQEFENPNELTRNEQREIRERALKEGREVVLARLNREIDRKQDDPRRARLQPWIELEAVHFEAQLDTDVAALLAKCFKWLGDSPAAWLDEEIDAFERARLSRVLEITLHLVTDHAAEAPDETQRLLDFVHGGTELDDESSASAWRRQAWKLLVGLDLSKQLEQSLRTWIDEEPLNPSWKRSLGYLLAENNRIAEAAAVFESLAGEKMLGAAEYTALAGWHQALDNQEAHERAAFRGLRASNEQQLYQAIEAIRNRVQSKNGGPTGELTERDIEILEALYATAQRPDQYSWQISNLYQQTKDPRVPAAYIGGFIGRSAGQIYAALQNFNDVSRMIEEEASVDAAIAEIERFRELELAESPTDRRALDLVEAELKRRASEVLNQPGQHIGVAVEAMQRAFNRDWADGERVLMAQWLSRLGTISQEAVRDEVLREFAALYRDEPEVMPRLEIAHQWGVSLNAHRRYSEVVERIFPAIREARAAHNGHFIPEMQNAFSQALHARWQLKHYRENERSIRAEIGRAANQQVDHWLTQQLFENYRVAVANRGSTDLGDFPGLFTAARKELIAEIENASHANHRYDLINSLCSLHHTAAGEDISNAGKLLVAYGSREFPELAARDWNRFEAMSGRIAQMIADIVGPRDALEFSIDMLDLEPGWRRLTGTSMWHANGNSITRYRSKAHDKLGDALAERTLAHMCDWLRWGLETREQRHLNFANVDSGYCWREKVDVFARVAEEHIERTWESNASIQFAAKFFHDFLNRYSRASDIMLALHAEKRLDESGRATMGTYLEIANRWKDSERIHSELTEDYPANAQYRVRLVRALYRQGKRKAAARSLAAAEEFFRDQENGLWNENNVYLLADIARETDQFERAIALYSDLIPIAENARQNRGVGEGTISRYYHQLAQSHNGLGQTKEAVDAVSAAIVAWGPRHDHRQETINLLGQILLASPDLDAFAQKLEATVEETGLENPIVRKSLGDVFLSKKSYQKAVKHLRLAIESQPNDAETHQKLIAALDQLGDAGAAREQLIASIRLAPRELSLIRDLANRFKKAENALGAERAWTGLVEAMPNEAEGHAALAQIREDNEAWKDAVAHWKRVGELRELEPTGLIGIARTEAKAGRLDQARAALERIDSKKWPNRFNGEIQEIRRLVGAARKSG